MWEEELGFLDTHPGEARIEFRLEVALHEGIGAIEDQFAAGDGALRDAEQGFRFEGMKVSLIDPEQHLRANHFRPLAYDPSLPVNGSKVKAAELRGQFAGLNEKIEAIPDGPPGPQGPQGEPGPQGPPGEVTNAALAAAIAGTSANTNAVATLDTPFTNDPPTLADMETLRAKFNEMLLAQRR